MADRYRQEAAFQNDAYSKDVDIELDPSRLDNVLLEFRAREIIKHLDLAKGKRILDIGCGSGGMAVSILGNINKGNSQIVGFDISKIGVIKARERALYHKVDGSTSWLIANAERLPFKDDTFDAVYCHATLHHIPDKDSCVREIIRVIKHQGRFYFAEPKKSILHSIATILFKKYIIARGRRTTTEEEMSEGEFEQLFANHNISFVSGSFWLGLLVFFVNPHNSKLNLLLVKCDKILAKIPFLKWISWGEVCITGYINKNTIEVSDVK